MAPWIYSKWNKSQPVTTISNQQKYFVMLVLALTLTKKMERKTNKNATASHRGAFETQINTCAQQAE